MNGTSVQKIVAEKLKRHRKREGGKIGEEYKSIHVIFGFTLSNKTQISVFSNLSTRYPPSKCQIRLLFILLSVHIVEVHQMTYIHRNGCNGRWPYNQNVIEKLRAASHVADFQEY